jgi:protein-disulfide isomerase
MKKGKKIEEVSNEEEKARIESLISGKRPELEEESTENVIKKKNEKIKNLISAVILIGGLFLGSLFVDIIQLFEGGGFSQRALDKADVFSSNGKTWVAYNDPLVTVKVVNDETCGDPCRPDEVLVGLKQAMPTMLGEKIDVNSKEGKKLIEQFSIKSLPVFIFSKEIEKTSLFANAEPFLDRQGDLYAIKSGEAGFPIGKYIAVPISGDNDIKIGSDDAKVKIYEFSDFSNPTDLQIYKNVIAPMLKDYGDKIQFVFKNYFVPSSVQSMSAALASECANDQGKFLPYAEKLYASQVIWSKLKNPATTFESYAAQLGLNSADFNQCLTDKKGQDKVSQTLKEGQNFGISETPSIFIGDNFQSGLLKYDDVKKIIDDQLNK